MLVLAVGTAGALALIVLPSLALGYCIGRVALGRAHREPASPPVEAIGHNGNTDRR